MCVLLFCAPTTLSAIHSQIIKFVDPRIGSALRDIAAVDKGILELKEAVQHLQGVLLLKLLK